MSRDPDYRQVRNWSSLLNICVRPHTYAFWSDRADRAHRRFSGS
ncbi:hypothetical protein HS053_08600 [Tabrizicola sp. SY72]|nr:hypothetical protein [Tabrizicola sp. SY72]